MWKNCVSCIQQQHHQQQPHQQQHQRLHETEPHFNNRNEFISYRQGGTQWSYSCGHDKQTGVEKDQVKKPFQGKDIVFIAYFSSLGKRKMLPPRCCWQFLTLENANSKVWSWHNQVSIGEQTFPYIRVQRETFFQSRDENEIFSYSIAHIETRRKFLALNLRLQDETEKNFLQIRDNIKK